MNNKIISFGNKAYVAGLFILSCSMALSKFGMSLGQFFILGGWLLSGDLQNKWQRLKENKSITLLLIALFGLHIIGLIHTSDFIYAFKDIRIKLPLLVLPILIFSMPPLSRIFRGYLFLFFILSVLISTLISFSIFMGWSNIEVHDIRDISRFVSHIRLALFICVSIILLIDDFKTNHRWVNLVLIAWFLLFLILLQSLTAVIIMAGFVFIAMLLALFNKNISLFIRILSGLGIMAVIFLSGYFYKLLFIDSIKPIRINESQMLKYTSRGNTYYSLPERQDIENGHPVWINICDVELSDAWNERTGQALFDTNPNGHFYYYSVIRFLSSKGWNKDREGVMGLSSNEITAIKKGCSNVEHMDNKGIGMRIKNLAWEYRQYYYYGDVSGHSFAQRLAYWPTGLKIFKQNWLVGVGTGDVDIAFKKQYDADKSKLEKKWRLRAHNQYITLGIAFGVSGILLLLMVLSYPIVFNFKKAGFVFSSFLLIAAISMLSEDTLETQAGITFFVFLYCLFWRERGVE